MFNEAIGVIKEMPTFPPVEEGAGQRRALLLEPFTKWSYYDIGSQNAF